MATTEPATRASSEELERFSDRHIVPVLVLEINDERSRSRLREAGLVSIIFHLLLFMTLPALLRYSPGRNVKVWTAQEIIDRNRELTYLEMPKDNQRVTKRPNTEIISDKDRIATSRHPTLDEKTMKELRDSSMRRAGPIAPPSPPPGAGCTTIASPVWPGRESDGAARTAFHHPQRAEFVRQGAALRWFRHRTGGAR